MNLAENLRTLREKRGMTQEQLAERMEVSRQTVSKWESGGSYPEMEKLLALSELFHCTMDELLKGNIRQGSLEAAEIYESHGNWAARTAAAAVCCCILSVAMQGLAEWAFSGAVADSGVVFLLFVLAGVLLWVRLGMESAHFRRKYPYVEPFYTEEEKEAFHRKYTSAMVAGIGLIIAAVVIMAAMSAGLPESGRNDGLMGFVFFAMVAAGVTAIVYIALLAAKYNVEGYNADNAWETSAEGRKNGRRIGMACGIIMMAATALYVALSAQTDKWGRYWWLFAVGGILCGVASILLNRRKD